MSTGTPGSVQVYNDDLRYCDQDRAGLQHRGHRYSYEFVDEKIERCKGSYWCEGLSPAEAGRPWPDRPVTKSMQRLLDLLGDQSVRFWMCARDGHGSSFGGPPRETVRWINGVAHCTTPDCGRTSRDPQQELDTDEPAEP